MKLDIKVENLGKLKKGTVKIRPFTVLTGENGTGKSFFTKTLYSIFSVLNKNVLHIEIISLIKKIEHDLNIFILSIQRKSATDELKVNGLLASLNSLKDNLNQFKDESIGTYIIKLPELYAAIKPYVNKFEKHLNKVKSKPSKIKFIQGTLEKLNSNLKDLSALLEGGRDGYANILSNNLTNEIRENFQILNLYELISFNAKKCSIFAENSGLDISFNSDNFVAFNLKHEFIREISNLSRVVFFESPAYWSVRDALNKSKDVEEENDLTGVSKYFYDLDKVLNTKSTNLPIVEISEIAQDLRQEIGGEFKFENGRLSFTSDDRRDIDKNLISFGMTNLGMIQALLKNNVISKGSFVFFDEPETNLHPAWQVLLTKVLIKLAENGVNVVMATHSLDMIKALEVHTKDKNGDFIAINHFTKEGGLFEFDSDDVTENLIKSRNELMNAYEDLFLSELYNPTDE